MRSSDSDFGGSFWERKMRSYFRVLDVDKDSVLTMKDFERLADRYVEIGKLDEVKAKQVRRKIQKIWLDYFEKDAKNGQMNEIEFVEAIRAREALIFETAMQVHGLYFDLMDLSGDGFVQKDEFQIFHKVFSIDNEKQTAECFKSLDTDGDGQLSYEEFTHAGYEYFGSGDESLPSKYLYGPLLD